MCIRDSRGDALEAASEVYRGSPTDVQVSPRVLRDPDGKVAEVLIAHGVATFETDYLRLDAQGGATRLDLPRKTRFHGYVDGRMILTLDEDWPAAGNRPALAAGALVAFDARTQLAQLIFAHNRSQAINAAVVTPNRVLVDLLEDVNESLQIFAPTADGWTRRRIELPKGSAITLRAADHGADRAYAVSYTHLTFHGHPERQFSGSLLDGLHQ